MNRERLRSIRGSTLRRNTATLLSGSGIALVITFGLQPVLSRLYSPAAFGIADAFVSLVSLVLPLASMKYEDAIMIPARKSEASTILVLAFMIASGFAALTLLALPFRDDIANYFGSPGLARWLLLAAPAILLYRLSELAELWMARSRKFGVASTSTAVRAAAAGSIRLGVGVWGTSGASPAGLIIGFLGGYVGSLVVLLTGRLKSAYTAVTSVSAAQLKDAARRYARFPRYTLPSALLSTGSGRLPFLLLLFYFDETTVGLFGRAFTAIVVPLTLIGSAVARSFFVHAADAYRDGTLAKIAERVHDRMVMIAILPAMLTLIAGPELFEVVFGQGWDVSGQYGRASVAWFALAGIASPLTRIFDVTERQRIDFTVAVITFVALVTGFVVGCRTGDALLAVTIGASGGALARIIQLAVLLTISRVRIRDAVGSYIRYITFATPAAALLVVAVLYGNALAVLFAALFGAAIYGLLCLRILARVRDPKE